MIRRSITVDDNLNEYINRFRAWFLVNENKEHDFTTVINMLANLGAYRLSRSKDELTKPEKRIIDNYLKNESQLKIEGATDEAWTRWFQIQYPDEMETKQVIKKSQSNSGKRKKKDDVPEAQ